MHPRHSRPSESCPSESSPGSGPSYSPFTYPPPPHTHTHGALHLFDQPCYPVSTDQAVCAHALFLVPACARARVRACVRVRAAPGVFAAEGAGPTGPHRAADDGADLPHHHLRVCVCVCVCARARARLRVTTQTEHDPDGRPGAPSARASATVDSDVPTRTDHAMTGCRLESGEKQAQLRACARARVVCVCVCVCVCASVSSDLF